MIVASMQFDLGRILSKQGFRDRCDSMIAAAKSDGAQVIVFPEYFTLSELVFSSGSNSPMKDLIQDCDLHSKEMAAVFSGFAKDHEVWIVAGTWPVREGQKIFNVCHTFAPDGAILSRQKKNKLTRFEEEDWAISPGEGRMEVFTIGELKCAVLVCFDVEFPELSQPLVDLDVDVLFVPSNSDDEHSYWRVRHCCHARTVENQCYVVQSVCVGGDPFIPGIEHHSGQAGIFSPCDKGFPEKGILALGGAGGELAVLAELDKTRLANLHQDGSVLNRKWRTPTNIQ